MKNEAKKFSPTLIARTNVTFLKQSWHPVVCQKVFIGSESFVKNNTDNSEHRLI